MIEVMHVLLVCPNMLQPFAELGGGGGGGEGEAAKRRAGSMGDGEH